jgi:enolase
MAGLGFTIFIVAMGTGHLKTGATCRGERVEKYNQLICVVSSALSTSEVILQSRKAGVGRERQYVMDAWACF